MRQEKTFPKRYYRSNFYAPALTPLMKVDNLSKMVCFVSDFMEKWTGGLRTALP